MEPSRPAGGGKPSKVEAIKLASQYLKTFVAEEVANGHVAYQRGRRDRPEVPRVVPAGRPRRPHAAQEGRQGEGVPVHGAGPDRRRQADGRPVPGLRPPGADDRQRHAPDHDAAGIPAPRRPQGRPQEHDPGDQREPALDAGGLRRRRAQRALLPRAAPRRRPRPPCTRTPSSGPRTAPRGRRATGTSGSTARRSRPLPPAGRSRSPPPGDDPVEPIYGKAYLPRKFKTAFALPEDNCTDIHANDLGYLAIVEDGLLVGYNVLVGGGLGTTPSAQKTFPFLAVPLCYVDRADVRKIGEAVIKVFRDFGNRSDRKRARLKYIIHDWGLPAFRAKVEEYLGHPLIDPRPVQVSRGGRSPRLARARGTASCSWASRSRTAGSRTRATSGCSAGSGRSSRGTGRPAG